MSAKLPKLPEGYRRNYSKVFDPQGKVVLSKWWMTQSCADALAREAAAKVSRMEGARAAKAAGTGESKAAIAKRLAQLREAQRKWRAKSKEKEAAIEADRVCVCGEPLLNARQKKCADCKRENKRERNRRHWESLKTQNKTVSASILPMKAA